MGAHEEIQQKPPRAKSRGGLFYCLANLPYFTIEVNP